MRNRGYKKGYQQIFDAKKSKLEKGERKRAGLLLVLWLFMVLVIPGPVAAALWDRGGGLLYDDVLNVTWLQDANWAATSGYDDDGRMTYAEATIWAEGLAYYDTVRGITWDDWRLPDTGDGSNRGSGYPEHYYMFYGNLNGSAGSFPGNQFVDGDGSTGTVLNLQPYAYWAISTAPGVPGTTMGMEFYFNYSNGDFGFIEASMPLYAWAVRDGDVSPVPLPPSMILLGNGLFGLGLLRWSRGQNSGNRKLI